MPIKETNTLEKYQFNYLKAKNFVNSVAYPKTHPLHKNFKS